MSFITNLLPKYTTYSSVEFLLSNVQSRFCHCTKPLAWIVLKGANEELLEIFRKKILPQAELEKLGNICEQLNYLPKRVQHLEENAQIMPELEVAVKDIQRSLALCAQNYSDHQQDIPSLEKNIQETQQKCDRVIKMLQDVPNKGI